MSAVYQDIDRCSADRETHRWRLRLNQRKADHGLWLSRTSYVYTHV